MWRGPMLHRALEQFLTDVHWGEIDVLVVDMPPGTGDVSISLGQLLPRAEVVVVTTPQKLAQDVAARAASMARKTNMRLLGVIENMTGDVFGTGGGESSPRELDVPLLGQVPLDPRAARAGRPRRADRRRASRLRELRRRSSRSPRRSRRCAVRPGRRSPARTPHRVAQRRRARQGGCWRRGSRSTPRSLRPPPPVPKTSPDVFSAHAKQPHVVFCAIAPANMPCASFCSIITTTVLGTREELAERDRDVAHAGGMSTTSRWIPFTPIHQELLRHTCAASAHATSLARCWFRGRSRSTSASGRLDRRHDRVVSGRCLCGDRGHGP